MSGFMSSTTALKIFEAPAQKADAEHLRKHVFTPAPGPDGKRIGWVGLGDPLDLEFGFGINHGQFMAFSLRVDDRKPSSAAIKIRLAEALKEESAANNGKKVSGQRKKELKEAITASVTAKADFIPTLTDCIWDLETGRLYVSSTSEGTLGILLTLFQTTFGIMPEPLTPKTDMADRFAAVFREGIRLNGMDVATNGYAVTLATPAQEEAKAQVAVVNNQAAIATALEDGLKIVRMALLASADEQELAFSLAADLSITGLKLPKGEKGDEADATFLLKADACARIASLVEHLSQ